MYQQYNPNPIPQVKLFLDIETLPSEEEKKEMAVEIMKAREMKKGKGEEGEGVDLEKIYLDTGFDGTFGRICCIGFIKEDHGSISKGVLQGEEKDMLTKFWQLAANVDRFIGHNIFEFDFPFIYQRSIILGVKTRTLSFAKYRNLPIYDTQCEWNLWAFEKKKSHKLDTLAKVLGLPTSKDKMDGSEVWSYFQAGKIAEICEYCLKDVELTRKVYYRMTFEEMPTEKESPLPLSPLPADLPF